MHKAFKACTAVLLALVMTVSLVNGALAAVVRNDDDTISYEPLEQGVYSKGGYTIDKVSHPTLGAGEVDGILTGDLQDRGQSYSWSMAEAGDYVYIGTCYNSTYHIYHNNVKTSLDAMKKEGKLDQNVDTSRAAADFVKVMFGTDTFDETPMSQWTPVIMAVNRYTGEAQVIFRERDILKDYPDIFPGYPPYLKGVNYLAGYRMAFEFKGKIYFAGMGNPTATLIEVDPETNECRIAYHNTNYARGVSNGVHGLLVFDDEIYMCLASDNYDGKGTPGGIIVASSDPSAGLSSWRRVADQDDFDNLPAVMRVDGLNGGGIWDIIEYNGSMYVTVVTDKSIDGHINKQGFAMYRGDKNNDGSFTWTQVIGDHGTSGYGFGLGINYSMSCNMWVYNGYLYLGTYNDPMLDLAEVPASGNFELLYNDLDHSIYLYRMDADGNFQQVAGKDDNPYFPDGPIGNLGAGLGNNSNQYVWRYGEHNGELYIGTYDTSTLTYQFTQITDGQVANMDYADISGRADMLKDAVLEVLQQHDNKYLTWFLDKVLFTKYTAHLYQMLAGFATDMSADKNPVPNYRNMLEEYEAFKQKVFDLLGVKLDSADFAQEYAQVTGVAMYSAEDKPLVKEHTHQWSDTWSSDGENHWHDCLADGCTVTDNSQKDGFGAHTFVDGVCSVCGYQQTGSGSGGDAGGSGQPSQPGQPGQPGQGGDSGNNGNTGDNGNTGNNGNTGDNGNTGNSGNTGNNGNTGNTGNTGDNGPKTGDKGAALWFALAGLCGCGLVAMAVAPRYKGKRVA